MEKIKEQIQEMIAIGEDIILDGVVDCLNSDYDRDIVSNIKEAMELLFEAEKIIRNTKFIQNKIINYCNNKKGDL